MRQGSGCGVSCWSMRAFRSRSRPRRRLLVPQPTICSMRSFVRWSHGVSMKAARSRFRRAFRATHSDCRSRSGR